MEFLNVDKKIKALWLIRRCIALCILLPSFWVCAKYAIWDEGAVLGIKITYIIFATLFVLMLLINIAILPKFQYQNYLYLVKQDEVVFMKGVIFKFSSIIPFIQIQDVGFTQGPLEQLFGLATVKLSTAGSTQFITGIKVDDAKEIVKEVNEKVKKILENKFGE